MLRVEPTEDFAYATEVIRRPEVYARIRDDSTPAIDAIEIPAGKGIILRAFDGDQPAGFFWFLERYPRIFEVHTNLTVNGSKALKLGRLGLEWIFTKTPCEKLVSTCRANNRAAAVYAALCGLRDDFELWPVTIDGQPVAQKEVSIYRHEWAANNPSLL